MWPDSGQPLDQEWTRMAAMLGPRVRDVRLTLAKPKAPLEPEELVSHFASLCPAGLERDPMRAINRVISEMSQDDMALAKGSVYFIDELYPRFLIRDGRVGLFPEAGA